MGFESFPTQLKLRFDDDEGGHARVGMRCLCVCQLARCHA
jgi:hypothetical protein